MFSEFVLQFNKLAIGVHEWIPRVFLIVAILGVVMNTDGLVNTFEAAWEEDKKKRGK